MVCQEKCLRMHVEAHYLVNFCPCGEHDVYPYPVCAHMMGGCFPEVHYTMDEDSYPQFSAIMRPLVKKALLLAVITDGFQTIIESARERAPLVSDKPEAMSMSEESPDCNSQTLEEEVEPPPKELTPRPERSSRLATGEKRLLRLQTDFTQLAPSLLTATTGLYQLKNSVGQIKKGSAHKKRSTALM